MSICWSLSCHELLGTWSEPTYLQKTNLKKWFHVYILILYYSQLTNSAILFQLSSQINHDFWPWTRKNSLRFGMYMYCMWSVAILVARKNVILFTIHGMHVWQMYNFVLRSVMCKKNETKLEGFFGESSRITLQAH